MNVVQHGASSEAYVAEKFEAKDLGTPFKVILSNAVTVSCDKSTGEIVSYKIPDLEGLLRTIVVTRILHPRRLTGADIKFVRKAVAVKQKDLATKIDMSVEHLSRCETGAFVMSPGSEKLLRIFALKTAVKLDKVKPCDAKTKLEDALDRLFDVIKPISVFDVDDELVLHFYRAKPETAENDGDENAPDDGQWNGDDLDKAA